MLSKTRAISKLSLRAVRSTGAFPAGSRLLQAKSRSMSSAHEQAALGPKSVDLVQTEEKFAAHNYHPLPVVFSEGHDVRITDPDGKTYYDFLSAYSAVNQGHQHPRIVKAMTDQLGRLALSSRAFYNDRLPGFSKFVTEFFGYERMLPMNTGAEAVETGLKIARKYAYERRGVAHDEAVILSACGCFHGRTLQAISMSCDPEAIENFGPLVPGHDKVLYDDLPHLEKKLKKHGGRVAAVILEPIQGEAGVRVPSEGYLKGAQELCRKYGALLIADEVQTGIARTGKLLCSEWDGIKPDITLLGKAVSGGLYPVSLVLTSAEIMSVITPGTHGSTFGGNPLACAVAEEALKVVRDEDLAVKAHALGERFRSAVTRDVLTAKGGLVESVRGRGLLNAIVLKTEGVDRSAWDLCLLLKERGLLAKPTHGNIIRFAPPLVMTEAQIDECTAIIAKAAEDVLTLPRDQIPGAAPEHKPHKDEHCTRCDRD